MLNRVLAHDSVIPPSELISLTNLSDVTITSGAQYNLLQLDGSSEWRNVSDLNMGAGDFTTTGNIYIGASGVLQNISTKSITASGNVEIAGDLKVTNAINEFSTDGTFSDNSDSAVPTEQATKTYVDAQVATENLWDRGGALLTTHNASDSVQIDGTLSLGASGVFGKISTEGITASGTLDMDSNFISNVLDPLTSQDAATKEYVDTTLGGISFNYFLSDTATGEASPLDVYNLMYPEETGEAGSTVAVAIDTDPKLIKAFITETTEPTFTILIPGTYTLFTHALVDATLGRKAATIYFNLYSRTAGGTETQIGNASENSTILTTSSAQILLHLNVSVQTVLATTDRLVVKIYGDTSGSGGDPTVTINMEGDNDCRVGILTTQTAFDDRYVNVEGDTMSGDLYISASGIFENISTDSITASGNVAVTGNVTGGNLNVSNWDDAYTHVSNNGTDHSYINQDVTSGSTPTFDATNFSDGGSNAIVTTTQETNWDNHIADNSQAHSDYLLNTSDTIAGDLTPDASGSRSIGAQATAFTTGYFDTLEAATSMYALTYYGDGSNLTGITSAETDPIVGAVTGIIKADGGGNISAASAGTDYYLLGETSTTAYRGDRGKTAYDHSQDNSQAHTDYLLNNASDTTTGTLTAAGFTTSGETRTADGYFSASGIFQNISTESITASGNITVTGTVDGIDIATDVAANTTHRGDSSQAHSDYLLNTGDTIAGNLTPDASGNQSIGTVATAFSAGYFDDLESSGDLYAKTLYGDGSNLTGIGVATDHSTLSNLTWSTAGHTIDADVVPTASGAEEVGTQGTAFSAGHFDTLEAGTSMYAKTYYGDGSNLTDLNVSAVAHSTLSNLAWSVAGHTIESDIVPTASGAQDIGTQALGFAELNSAIIRGDVIYGTAVVAAGITTDAILALGITDGYLTMANGVITSATNTNWDAAYTHVSNNGTDHLYIDQDVTNGSTPTFTATNITGVPAASVLAGTLGTGAYVFDNTITGVTNLTIDGSLLHTGDADTHIAFTPDVITFTYGGTAVTAANIKTALDHVTANGSSHGHIDQDVTIGSTPTFDADNFSDGGSNAIVTTTQETNWDNHIADNSQAHTDYLLNNGDDETTGTVTVAGLITSGAIKAGSGYLSASGVFENISTKSITASGNIAITGYADFSGADLELPQASPAAPTADGRIEVDMTDGTLVIQNSSSHTYLTDSTDVVYGKMLHSTSITILQPDLVQAVTDAVPLLAVEADEFPHGIEIVQVYLKTSESSSFSVVLEKWATPTDGAPDTLTTIATSTSTEVNEAPDTEGTVGTSEIIMVDLPDADNDIDWMQLTIVFYEPIA